jgi:Tfp pilus assembly ATPase PilU
MSSYIGSNKSTISNSLAVFLALATQTSEANQIRKAIKLNLEYFIAKRLITTKDYKSSILPIIKLLFQQLLLV